MSRISRLEPAFSGLLVPIPLPSSKSPRSLQSTKNGSTSARYSYTDTFEDTLQNMPQYSDTFTSLSGTSDINTVLSRSSRTVPRKEKHLLGAARVEDVGHFSYHHYQDVSHSESFEKSNLASKEIGSRDSYSETFETESLPPDTIYKSAESSRHSTAEHEEKAGYSKTASLDTSTNFDHTTASADSKDIHSKSDGSFDDGATDRYSHTFEPTDEHTEASDHTDVSQSPEDYSETFEDSDEHEEYSQTFEPTDEYSHTFEPADEYSQTFEPVDDYSLTFEPTEEYSSKFEDLETIQREKEIEQETEAAQHSFVQVLLGRLKQKTGEVTMTPKKPILKKPPDKPVDENEAKFCRRKMKLLKAKKKYGLAAFTAPPKPVSEAPKTSVVEYGLNPAIVERLKMENVMFSMKKATSEKFHDPSRCKKCRKHAEEIEAAEAEKLFIRSQTRKLQSEVIDEKIQAHIMRMNTVSMIGELLQTIPGPNDDPEEIMEKLYDSLKNGPTLHVPYSAS